jgi:hypothetical protein
MGISSINVDRIWKMMEHSSLTGVLVGKSSKHVVYIYIKVVLDVRFVDDVWHFPNGEANPRG